jgi:hypothetical protein
MSTPEVLMRLARAGVPRRTGPETLEELEEEMKIIDKSPRRK